MSEVTPNSPPMGGTELILANVKAALPELTEQVQIICSRPEQYTLDPNKPKVLWLQDLPQDPASQCLRDESYRRQFNRIVFVSHWQQQMYNMFLGIPFQQGTVIKNAVPNSRPDFPKLKVNDKLKFIYTSTPHRGLAILAAAADKLAKERQDWELHVYSSFNIYGWHDADKQFQPLYDSLNANPCVVYHGSKPNPEVREALKEAHVFVYPSIYAETSCMAAQEAMMAGCLTITSNFGALPETCAEWAWYIQYTEEPAMMAAQTHAQMNRALKLYDTKHVQDILQVQADYYTQFWSLETRIPVWKAMLEQCVIEGPQVEMFVVS